MISFQISEMFAVDNERITLIGLNSYLRKQTKIFQKYSVFHIHLLVGQRSSNQPHRNLPLNAQEVIRGSQTKKYTSI